MLKIQNIVCDEAAYDKWEERYSWCLRQGIRNGVDFLTPKLTGEFEGSKIDVIFTGRLAENKNGKYIDFYYREPHIDAKAGLPVSPAIFISEKDRVL